MGQRSRDHGRFSSRGSRLSQNVWVPKRFSCWKDSSRWNAARLPEAAGNPARLGDAGDPFASSDCDGDWFLNGSAAVCPVRDHPVGIQHHDERFLQVPFRCRQGFPLSIYSGDFLYVADVPFPALHVHGGKLADHTKKYSRLSGIFAFIFTCLTLLPAHGEENLRPRAGGSPSVQSGLEERLRSIPPTEIVPSLGQAQAGMEEAIWPEETPLELKNAEPILILRAEGGFGDIAYLIKTLDAFNARDLAPVVALVGTPEQQAAARAKLEQLSADIPVRYEIWREEAGRFVQADGRLVEDNRTKRPVLIQHFSLVNPGWGRDLADRIVPNLFQPLYRERGNFFLIGFNAPGNAFGGYLKPEQGKYINLYLTPPSIWGPHEPNAIYTGHLFDRPLKALGDRVREGPRHEVRREVLQKLGERVGLAQEVQRLAGRRRGWATLYVSQGGSETQLKALLEAFRRAYPAGSVFFTSFGRNPRLWYYPDDYWRDHRQLVDLLKQEPDVNFVDLTRDSGTKEPIFGSLGSLDRPQARILVVNLPPLPMGLQRELLAASNLVLAPGHNTFMEVMGMAARQAGPDVLLTFPLFKAERRNVEISLLETGSAYALEGIQAFHALRDSEDGFDQTVVRLRRLLRSGSARRHYRQEIGDLATQAMTRTGQPLDGNLNNRMLDLITRLDDGASLAELLPTEPVEPSAVEAYQREAEATFRSGVEIPRPGAGLEELSQPGWKVVEGAEGIPSVVLTQRIRTAGSSQVVEQGPVALLQRGLVPAGVRQHLLGRGWRVEELPEDLTDERLIGEVQAALTEWDAPLLVVVEAGLEEAVKRLPAYGRITAVLLDLALAQSLNEAHLAAYLMQTVRDYPGRFLWLESVMQAGLEQFDATATQL